jgi:hypothetical protein
MTVAGVGFPSLLGMSKEQAAPIVPSSSRTPSKARMWDYQERPVKVSNPGLEETWNNGSHFAFDGYGGSLHPGSIAHGWFQPGIPSEQKPFFCTVDYGEPVAVSKFVHYFYVPTVRDYRTDPLALSTAFSSLNVYRSDDGVNWVLAEGAKEMSPDWPQVVTFSDPKPARYYKLEVTGLIGGAQGVRTYEIESFTGPVIRKVSTSSAPLKTGEICEIRGELTGAKEPSSLNVTIVPSKDFQSSSSLAKVDSTGAFSLSLLPLRSGYIPIIFELKDRQNEVVDRRTQTLKIDPRVVVSDVKAIGQTVTGHLSNTGTSRAFVEVAGGTRFVSVGRVSQGGTSEFRFAKLATKGGRQLVELQVTENSRVASRWAFPVERPAITQQGRLQNQRVAVTWSADGGKLQFQSLPNGGRTAIRATMEATFDDSAVSFSASEASHEKVVLWGSHPKGWLECTLQLAGSSARLSFRNLNEGLQQEEKTSGVLIVRLRPEAVKFRFMPAYVYSKELVSYFEGVYGKQPLVVGGWFPPTRMVALETTEGTLGLVPDRDRCLMGIEQDDAVLKVRLHDEPTDLLVPVVAGDWFECFRYVVGEIYKFTEPRQYRPLIESLIGEARYLSSNEDIWSKRMQVVTSFPKVDYVYAFYGLTYTIPALFAWYQISGDLQALERARKCVRWLLDYPDVRVKEGPAVGAFFSQYVSPETKTWQLGSLTLPLNGIGGCDQANNRWLEPHASGAVAWTLLHYYVVDGKQDRSALEAAKAALDWLLRIQNPSGGWLYAYRPDGTPLTEEEDAGNIWNIWALYRYGKLTGEQKYLVAADKAKGWFASKFLSKSICRGYWEDVSGANGHVGLSWEAYEFGIATNVFADMGDKELAVKAARNAVTWIWTRVVDCREYFNSYGHAHEQWNWPPATYVAPMFGLAAQTAYRLTRDEIFSAFAGAAKTIGWWIVRESGGRVWPARAAKTDVGGAFWPLEGTEFVPIEEPLDVTFWVDWISSQQCTICLRWLVNELNHRSGSKIAVDPEILTGSILGEPGRVALRPEEVRVKAQHEQLNWLGYQTERTRVLAILNHDVATRVSVDFPELRSVPPTVLTSPDGNEWRETTKEAGASLELDLPQRGCVLLVWSVKSI